MTEILVNGLSQLGRFSASTHGDFEGFWSQEQTSHVRCVEPSDLVAKIAYAMANPVEAYLVKHGRSWPGVRVAWPAKARTVRRPKTFFRGEQDGGTWPETAALELSRPPGYENLSDGKLAALIQTAIDEREAQFRQEARQTGKSFMGRRLVLQQSRYARPTSREERFRLSPRVACKSKWRRIERLAQNRAWWASYSKALAGWTSGDREVEFPYGTYKMRVLHGVECAAPPD